jgi:alpha-1,6-mannosyltransferase
MLKGRGINYGHALILCSFYFLIGYYIERHNTLWLLLSYSIMFASYLYVFRKNEQVEFWVLMGIVFRFILVFSIPALSDDFYRFIWDGRLLAAGVHPFAHIPSYYIANDIAITGIDTALYDHLNSKEYFTIYPPVTQFIFWFSVKFAGGSIFKSIVIMKMIIVGCEVGSLILIIKLLERFNLPLRNVILYALNPLVIIELTGNIHFEAVMIFFLLLSIWMLVTQQLVVSAIAMGVAVGVKLLPLIFLPLLLLWQGFKKSIIFYFVTAITLVVLFTPLHDIVILDGFKNSLGYYFQKFEFNASVYYMVREWGFMYYGYNIIQTVGWKLGLIATFLILLIAFIRYKKDQAFELTFIQKAMWCLLIYFVFTTTLHPWYITTLLVLSVFTSYRFITLWSGLIFLTYWGYSVSGYNENMIIIFAEYILVFGYLGYELWTKRKTTF